MIRIAMLVAALGLTAPAALAQGPAPSGPQAARSSGGMAAAMEHMQRDVAAMPMSGNADRDWAMMMRRHHQAAIDMSRAYMGTGRDREIERMAQKLIEDQTHEIREIDDWMRRNPR